ncbi:C4-dicarboxylate transporter DctA [Caballeronia sp. J97]|uniref:C4-dicarboxylate transporter DctA n=1 Tax=Caballeronia sp. J97 TaxID=2805429 RepID=UPI0039F10551
MRVLKHLYVQVLIGLAAGIVVGYFAPKLGVQFKPLGDTFIRLIKMLITLLIFCTVSVGIARMESLKQVGRVGFKTILYFEIVTTIALVIGMVVANVVHPGAGLDIDPKTLDPGAVSHFVTEVHSAEHKSLLEELVPNSVVGAFARGDLLQVLLFSVLFGVALSLMSERSKFLALGIEQLGDALMRIVEMIMRLAPLGAFGAIAFTVGKYGIGTLQQLGLLILCFYVTSILFVVLVLGTACRWAGVSLWSLLRYLREELLIVLGTSTTESVLPRLMEKLERLGCPKSVVGLVLPTGYSFNLDGAAIYLTMTSLFIAQATNTHLSLMQQLGLLAILLLTSKGGAGVAGAALVALTATLSSHDIIPVAGITLIIGIDRVLNEIRALVNMIGNAVATLVVARWEGVFDVETARVILADPRAALEEETRMLIEPAQDMQK